ncbi:MAG: radical SAM protein [Patescibacteria group bacterium]
MKVLLFDIKAKSDKKCINKDLAGGMGTGTWVGRSLEARIFEFAKKKNVVLPVITTAYLAAIFKRAGWQVSLIQIKSPSDLSEKKADLALIPVSIVDYKNELEIIKKIKKQGIHTGVYGAFVSMMPEIFLEDCNFVIVGEPESAILKIISENKLPNGVFNAGHISDLDLLPFPDWSQFPIKQYSYSPALNKKPVLVMLGSRGCPYSCSFYCPYPLLGGKTWRPRSYQKVADEMEYLKKEYKIKAIDFRDPIFTLDRDRAKNLSKEIIKRKLDIIWSCETRLDRLDKDLINIMYEAGLRNINIGVESYDHEVLMGSKRLPIEYQHQEEIIDFCHKKGISLAAFYIIGLENDTKKSIMATINYAKKLNTLIAQFAISTPYPGTCFYDKLKREGRIKNFNWEDHDEYTPVFEHKNLSSEELLSLKEKAFVSYYFRPEYILRYMPKYFFEKFLWPF